METVLITGASGMIGQILMSRLSDTYNLRGLDIRPSEGVAIVSVADYDALLPRLDGVDVVIHLAALINIRLATWEENLEHNIIGTRNVFEAAKEQGVRRVVFASSHQSTRHYWDEEPYASVLAGGPRPPDFKPITADTPFRPNRLYGVSKAFGEVLGRMYSHYHGLSILCIRIVQVNPENRPSGPGWFSHDDLEQMVRRCIEAKDIPFGVYYGVSGNKHAIWDISNSERELGHKPKDGASNPNRP